MHYVTCTPSRGHNVQTCNLPSVFPFPRPLMMRLADGSHVADGSDKQDSDFSGRRQHPQWRLPCSIESSSRLRGHMATVVVDFNGSESALL